MDETQTRVVACVRAGMTIEQAAQEAGRPIGTVRRWLTNGRSQPDGPYGVFARAVEAARVPVPEAFAGNRLAEIEAVAASLDTEIVAVRARLGLARGLASKLDWCEQTPTGAAAMAMANLSKQYRDVLGELAIGHDDDQRWLAELFRDPDDNESDGGQLRAALQTIAQARSDGSAAFAEPRYTAEEMVAIAKGALAGEERDRSGDGTTTRKVRV